MAPHASTLARKSHGQRSLVGCSPWGRKDLDVTEWLHFHFSLSCIGEGNGNPLQCSCLENPRDGGAWWVAIYGVARSRTRLKRLSSSRYYTKCGEYILEQANRAFPHEAYGLNRKRTIKQVITVKGDKSNDKYVSTQGKAGIAKLALYSNRSEKNQRSEIWRMGRDSQVKSWTRVSGQG